MVKCAICGTKNGTGAKFCQSCGKKIKQPSSQQVATDSHSWKKWAWIVSGVVILAFLALQMAGRGVLSSHSEPVTYICWDGTTAPHPSDCPVQKPVVSKAALLSDMVIGCDIGEIPEDFYNGLKVAGNRQIMDGCFYCTLVKCEIGGEVFSTGIESIDDCEIIKDSSTCKYQIIE